MTAPSPKLAREQRHEAMRRTLRRLLHEHDVPLEQLALDLGVSRQLLARYLSDAEGAELHAADLEGLPPLVRRPIVEALAETLGCTLADLPDAEAPLSDVRMLATTARESGEVVAAYGDALADGSLTADEARVVEGRCDLALAAFASLRLRMRAVRRSRCEGVRVIEGGKR